MNPAGLPQHTGQMPWETRNERSYPSQHDRIRSYAKRLGGVDYAELCGDGFESLEALSTIAADHLTVRLSNMLRGIAPPKPVEPTPVAVPVVDTVCPECDGINVSPTEHGECSQCRDIELYTKQKIGAYLRRKVAGTP